MAASSAARPTAAASADVASALTAPAVAGTGAAADAAAGLAPMLGAAAARLCSQEGAVAAGPVAAASSGFAAAGPIAAATPASASSGFATAGPVAAATAALPQLDLWLRPAPTSSEADGMTAAVMHSVQHGSCAALQAAALSDVRPAAAVVTAGPMALAIADSAGALTTRAAIGAGAAAMPGNPAAGLYSQRRESPELGMSLRSPATHGPLITAMHSV